MLSELDARHTDSKLDITIIGRVEAKLKQKLPLVKELVNDHEFDIGARLAGVTSGGQTSTSTPTAQPASTVASTSVDVILGADADTSSFVKLAKDYKNNCAPTSALRRMLWRHGQTQATRKRRS